MATDWLLAMGLDLRTFAKDRVARNEASYRPTRLNSRPELSSSDATAIVEELWTLLEPEPSLPFVSLDRYLLRSSLEVAFRATTGSSHARAPRRYADAIKTVVAGMMDGVERGLWEGFLLRRTEPNDPLLIRLAREAPAIGLPYHHVAVMARALLLLRVASGAARDTLVDGGLPFDKLGFWWHALGLERGLWATPPAAEDLADGWADADLALEAVRLTRPLTYRDLVTTTPSLLGELTGTERVGLWSLAS
jgi:hypothetical protein